MKKILSSLLVVSTTAVIAVAGTRAFFQDTETSTGNVLAAGSIDLQIDNTSYYNGVTSPNTTWTISDLTIQKFFDFRDLKPGDYGEDTISAHVNNNDSWLCADVTLTSDDDNGLTEPEGQAGDTSPGLLGIGEGELADQVNFLWWADDGDNVLETNETTLPGGPLGALAVNQTATVALADSSTNIWGDTNNVLPGDSTRYIGKGWCFGAITETKVTQDNLTTNGPTSIDGATQLPRGAGFTCNGSLVDNTAQSDSLTADVTFRAVQSRNNTDFRCVVL
ncbi:MAG: hypothetical protein AAB443_02275 [Patescibacteria group bacterium]